MRLAFSAALTCAIFLGLAAGAQAASISYIGSDGNVWITSPDGAVNKRVTSDATADNKYRSPSQENDGTIVATRKASGSTSFAFFLDPVTGTAKDSWLLPWRGGTGFSTYTGAQVSAPGGLIVYDYNRFDLPAHSSVEVGFVSGPGITNPCLINCHTDSIRPRWIPNSPYAAFLGTDFQTINTQSAGGVKNWTFVDGADLIDSFDVSSNGKTLVETSAPGGTTGSPSSLILMDGAPPNGPDNFACAAVGFSRITAAPRWSPDASQIAWEGNDGVYVSPAPVANGTTCVLQPKLIAPGGTQPAWGPANVPAGPGPGGGGGTLTPEQEKKLEKLLKKCKKKHSKKAKKKCKKKAKKKVGAA